MPVIILEMDHYTIAIRPTIDLILQRVTSAVGLTVCSSYAGGWCYRWNCSISVSCRLSIINWWPLLVKFIKHNQNYYLKIDVSISIRGLYQKKLVLSSSGSWHDGKTPCQESGRMRGSVGIAASSLFMACQVLCNNFGCVWWI